MMIMLSIVFVAAMALAWAIGGEYRFGKGKRGLLLAIPMTVYAIGHLSFIGMAIQVVILYAIYQCLFYDDGISMIYDKADPRGWLIVMINGAMSGLTGCMFGVAANSMVIVLMGIIAGSMTLMQVVELSNDKKYLKFREWLAKHGPQYIPYVDDKGKFGYYINFKDAWWVCSAIMGASLGLQIALCLALAR